MMMLRLTLASAVPPSAVGSANVRFPDRQVTAARWSPTMTLCFPLQKCESTVTGPATSGIVIGPLRPIRAGTHTRTHEVDLRSVHAEGSVDFVVLS
jgi:hypothetical protein